jgi:predicted acyltransferase
LTAVAAVDRPQLRPKTRLASLDAFRGMTIAAMILVNDPGDRRHIYWPLEHANWNGWTPTDLIFPFFLFIVGVSLVLSFKSRTAQGATRSELILHSAKRSAILFGLGVFLYAYPRFDIHTTRILGVLQRIAIVNLATSLLILYAGRTVRYVAAAVILLGYWALMTRVPVPGYGAGILTMDGSLASYIDRALLYNHLEIAHRFDPEGLLSSIPAIATCLFGVFAGECILNTTGAQLMRTLLASALGLISLGYVWSFWFPFNKKLWTSSYVLLTAGMALGLVSFCYWVVEVRGWRKWVEPFVWLGVNPLAIYFLASFVFEVIGHPLRGIRFKQVVYQHCYAPYFANPYSASLFYAITYLLLFWILAWTLYQNKLLIRL